MIFTAKQILDIPVACPEKLFSPKDIKRSFWELARTWHPDTCDAPDASAVFAHINSLYKTALHKLNTDTWNSYGQKTFTTLDGKTYRTKYQYMCKNSTGACFVGHTRSIWYFDKKHERLFLNAKKRINALEYTSTRMKNEVGKYMPVCDTYETEDSYILSVRKTADLVPLRALLVYFKDTMEPKHVAWVISSILSITCYLKWAGIVHNDISLDSCFISPEHHSVCLLGGWEYSCTTDTKLKAMPKRTYNLVPMSVKQNKIATHNIDTQLVRAIGRELLGDVNGTTLRADKNVPDVFAEWSMLPGSDDPYKEYDMWMSKVLPAAYGKRKFIKMDVRNNIQDVYNSNKQEV